MIFLLDTDIMSAVMKRHPVVMPEAEAYLSAYHRFTFSIITRYEILRGLQAKRAEKQITAFNQLCLQSHVVPLTDDMIVKAAEWYSDLYRRGELVGDADLLIAATAYIHDYTLNTNNTDHFDRLSGLSLHNRISSP